MSKIINNNVLKYLHKCINRFVSAISASKINQPVREKSFSRDIVRYNTATVLQYVLSSSVNNISRIKISLLNACKQNTKFQEVEGRSKTTRQAATRVIENIDWKSQPVIESSWRGWWRRNPAKVSGKVSKKYFSFRGSRDTRFFAAFKGGLETRG